jgi:hypothetical protein
MKCTKRLSFACIQQKGKKNESSRTLVVAFVFNHFLRIAAIQQENILYPSSVKQKSNHYHL